MAHKSDDSSFISLYIHAYLFSNFLPRDAPTCKASADKALAKGKVPTNNHSA